MKKISILLMSVLAFGLASCDMDKTPYNSISDSEALQTPTDFANLRVGLYSPMRSLASGDYLTAQEIMGNNMNAVQGFSNTYGDLYRWQFTASTSTFDDIYSGYQTLIGRANFILSKAPDVDLSDKDVFSASDSTAATKIVAEAHFMRAFALFNLAQDFCADYETSTADNANSGVSYSTTYTPSSVASSYPARKTLNETYAQIAEDLEAAKTGIATQGEAATAYVSKDIITALEARVALAKHDYTTAAAKAVELINSGRYVLCQSADEILSMYKEDNGQESIWQIPVPSTNELASQTGECYLPYTSGSTPDYIPTGEFVELFSANDNRRKAYFRLDDITTTGGTSGTIYEFNKFPDTTAVYIALGKSESARFMSEPKVFRIAEMYLIAAEAYAQSGDLTNAAKYLNELEAARISGYTNQTFSNINEFMPELKRERRRELAGEGFAITDLKRWHEGVTRGTPQQLDLCLFPGSTITTNLTVPADNNRLTFPIPKAEIDANPQVVQNPGY